MSPVPSLREVFPTARGRTTASSTPVSLIIPLLLPNYYDNFILLVIQSLWHLSSFRKLVIQGRSHRVSLASLMRDTFVEYQVRQRLLVRETYQGSSLT